MRKLPLVDLLFYIRIWVWSGEGLVQGMESTVAKLSGVFDNVVDELRQERAVTAEQQSALDRARSAAALQRYEAALVDFGEARIFEAPSSRATSLHGTLAYLAPEMLSRDGHGQCHEGTFVLRHGD